MVRTVLLICGILSPVLYAVSDVLAGMQWPGYSFRDQTISELGAIGAPSRMLFSALLLVVYGLMVAFGVGIWKVADRNRRLQSVGGLLVGVGVMALTVGQFAPMRLRGTEQGFVGAMHLIEGMVAMIMIFTAMGVATTAFGTRFRFYTIATILLALWFGAWTGLEAPRIAQGLATPWVGVEERIFWYGYQSWFIVLALTLLRQRFKAGVEDSGHGGKADARYRLSISHPPAFKTPAGQVAYRAAYDAAMKLWPVPYEEANISTPFGMTHVVACGPRDAPPLVLLHGYWATLTMWKPNVADFSRGYRVYAVDIMGQPGKSIPDQPIRNAADYVAWLTSTLNGLHLDRVSLVGMSYGGWLALTYAVAAPERVEKLVLLSPAASILPIVRQFSIRGMLMLLLPTRFTVNSFMRWLGIKDNPGGSETRRAGDNIVDLIYLGLKHFRMPQEVMPTVFSDGDLRSLNVPTLLLIGAREVIYDPATALARAHRLIPNFQGDLLPSSSHDMCFSQQQLVDAHILDFLRERRTDDQDKATGRSVA